MNWRVKRAEDADSFWRLSATPPNGDLSVAIYAFKRAGTIELKKLVKADRKLFKNLGELRDERKIRQYLLHTRAIERRYGRDSRGFYALARFETAGTYGFVALVVNRSSNFLPATEVVESLNISVPAGANFKNMLSEPGKWLGGLALSLMVIGVLYILGKTGQMLRKGIAIKKALLKVAENASRKGLRVNRVWYKFNRKASLFIWCPIVGWVGLYLVLALVLPFKLLFFSLLGLLVPVLGYFGIFFVPTDDGAAYLPKGL